MARRSTTDDARLAGVVASYVRANPRPPDLDTRLDALYEYVRVRGFAGVSREALGATVAAHQQQLEAVVDLRRREAELFSAGRTPRPTRYRHGSAFCGRCGMYKNHRKECSACGHLELTV